MADDYACLFPSMIRSWRQNFNRPDAFFGYVQLSTWCPGHPNVTWPSRVMGYMRDVQLLAQSSPFSAYATNADHGAGCDVHPPSKQFCAKRLAASALAIVYQKPIAWRSPSYAYAVSPANGVLTIWLNDVTPAGLVQINEPYNLPGLGAGVNCTALNQAYGDGTCAWAALQFNDAAASWVNATVSIAPSAQQMVLTAPPPTGSTAIIASSYGYGAIPMMTVYLADRDLPVLTWEKNITA